MKKNRLKSTLGLFIAFGMMVAPIATIFAFNKNSTFSITFDGKKFVNVQALETYLTSQYSVKTSQYVNENYYIESNGKKTYLGKTQLDQFNTAAKNNTNESLVYSTMQDVQSNVINPSIGELNPQWFVKNSIEPDQYINIYRGNDNTSYLDEAKALDTYINSGYEIYYFNDIYFRSKQELYKYLINIYFKDVSNSVNTTLRIKAPNGEYSSLINMNSKSDWKTSAAAFIEDNAIPIIKIKTNDGYKYISSESTDAISDAVEFEDIPYIKVNANQGKQNYVVGINKGDSYEFSGTSYYQGYSDIEKGFTIASNWERKNTNFVADYNDTLIANFNNSMNSFFGSYIDFGTSTVTESNGNSTRVVYNSLHLFDSNNEGNKISNYLKKDGTTFTGGVDLSLDTDFDGHEENINFFKLIRQKYKYLSVESLSSLSETFANIFYSSEYQSYKYIYDETLAASNNYTGMSNFNALLKIPLLYCFMMDRLISAGAPNKLIEITIEYFKSVAEIHNTLLYIKFGRDALTATTKYASYGVLDLVSIFGIGSKEIQFDLQKYESFFIDVYPALLTIASTSSIVDFKISLGFANTADSIEELAIYAAQSIFSNDSQYMNEAISKTRLALYNSINIGWNVLNNKKILDYATQNSNRFAALTMIAAKNNDTSLREQVLDSIEDHAGELLNSPDSWEYVPNDNVFKKYAYFIYATEGKQYSPNDILLSINTLNTDSLYAWVYATNEMNKFLEEDSNSLIANVIFDNSLDTQRDYEDDKLDDASKKHWQKIDQKFYDYTFANKAVEKNTKSFFTGIYQTFNEFLAVTVMRMLGDLSQKDTLFVMDKNKEVVMINQDYAKAATAIIKDVRENNPKLVIQLTHLYRSFQLIQQQINELAELYEFEETGHWEYDDYTLRLILKNTAQYASIINQNIDYFHSQLTNIGVPIKTGQIIAYSGTVTSMYEEHDNVIDFDFNINEQKIPYLNGEISTDAVAFLPKVDKNNLAYVIPNIEIKDNEVKSSTIASEIYSIPTELIEKYDGLKNYEYSFNKYLDISQLEDIGITNNSFFDIVYYFNKNLKFDNNKSIRTVSNNDIFIKKWGYNDRYNISNGQDDFNFANLNYDTKQEKFISKIDIGSFANDVDDNTNTKINNNINTYKISSNDDNTKNKSTVSSRNNDWIKLEYNLGDNYKIYSVKDLGTINPEVIGNELYKQQWIILKTDNENNIIDTFFGWTKDSDYTDVKKLLNDCYVRKDRTLGTILVNNNKELMVGFVSIDDLNRPVINYQILGDNVSISDAIQYTRANRNLIWDKRSLEVQNFDGRYVFNTTNQSDEFLINYALADKNSCLTLELGNIDTVYLEVDVVNVPKDEINKLKDNSAAYDLNDYNSDRVSSGTTTPDLFDDTSSTTYDRSEFDIASNIDDQEFTNSSYKKIVDTGVNTSEIIDVRDSLSDNASSRAAKPNSTNLVEIAIEYNDSSRITSPNSIVDNTQKKNELLEVTTAQTPQDLADDLNEFRIKQSNIAIIDALTDAINYEDLADTIIKRIGLSFDALVNTDNEFNRYLKIIKDNLIQVDNKFSDQAKVADFIEEMYNWFHKQGNAIFDDDGQINADAKRKIASFICGTNNVDELLDNRLNLNEAFKTVVVSATGVEDISNINDAHYDGIVNLVGIDTNGDNNLSPALKSFQRTSETQTDFAINQKELNGQDYKISDAQSARSELISSYNSKDFDTKLMNNGVNVETNTNLKYSTAVSEYIKTEIDSVVDERTEALKNPDVDQVKIESLLEREKVLVDRYTEFDDLNISSENIKTKLNIKAVATPYELSEIKKEAITKTASSFVDQSIQFSDAAINANSVSENVISTVSDSLNVNSLQTSQGMIKNNNSNDSSSSNPMDTKNKIKKKRLNRASKNKFSPLKKLLGKAMVGFNVAGIFFEIASVIMTLIFFFLTDRKVPCVYSFKVDNYEWNWSGGLYENNFIEGSAPTEIRTASNMYVNQPIRINATYLRDSYYYEGKLYEDSIDGKRLMLEDYISNLSNKIYSKQSDASKFVYSFDNLENGYKYSDTEIDDQLKVFDSREELSSFVINDIENWKDASKYVDESLISFSDGWGGNWSSINSDAAINSAANNIQSKIRPIFISMRPILDSENNLLLKREYTGILPGNSYNLEKNIVESEEDKKMYINNFDSKEWFIIDDSTNYINDNGNFIYDYNYAAKKAKENLEKITKDMYKNKLKSIVSYQTKSLLVEQTEFNEILRMIENDLRPIQVLEYYSSDKGSKYFVSTYNSTKETNTSAFENLLKYFYLENNIKLELVEENVLCFYEYNGLIFDNLASFVEFAMNN